MSEKIADLCRLISHGVYVIGVRDGEKTNAFTAAWVMQVSFSPVMLALSINPEHYSYRLLEAGKCCSVNVLGRDQMIMTEHFGRSAPDKMAGYVWQQEKTGAPVLSESLAYFDCELSHFTDAGDHRIAVLRVVDAAMLRSGPSMLYSQTGDMDGSSELYDK
ncbi:flavin reductase family protein [Methylotuvimicrobium sp. KM2]|uniref:flavin reductase family protein n=1 Tax=Methylotuvimicrobium sp. KM2 TaxID=3133976 RepID=UPI0031014201